MSREDDFTYHNDTEDTFTEADTAWDDLETEDIAVYDDMPQEPEADGGGADDPARGQAAPRGVMRKSVRKTVCATLCGLLLLTAGIACAFWIYARFLATPGGNVSGEWAGSLDMTEYAAAAAFFWLQDIEDAEISLEEVSAAMQDLTIQVNLTMQKTSRYGGKFSGSLAPESYEACRQAAYEALAGLFREIAAERLRTAGYGDSAAAESVETLAEEAFGMSTVAFLMEKGPALLPTLEKMQEKYGASGIYETKDGILARRPQEGQPEDVRAERYLRKGSLLILSKDVGSDAGESFFGAYPIIYEKQ